jgi:hypothetical protein
VVFCILAAKPLRARVTLPIEVVGGAGTTASVRFDVPADRARDVRSLRLQIHNLAFADMVSVQVNDSQWTALNNKTAAVAEPGKSYGGIGGAYSTLKLTMPLPGQVVVDGPNTIRFRFNGTDGLTSGFRVLAFNLSDASGQPVLAPDAFAEEDPTGWTSPLTDSNSISAGASLWQSAPLQANGLPAAKQIRAHCADCHAQDGRDLKYFNFSNESIIARSRFHGLSELQGRQIASYIRTLKFPSPGRPWNPPYQPGPGLDALPITNWSAGAGLAWVLDDDAATLPYIFGGNGAAAITSKAFEPDGNLNTREIPVSLQLPDWNHWLPQVHPLDAWGDTFSKSEFALSYDGTASKPGLHALLAGPNLAERISSGKVAGSFERWREARRIFLKPYVESANVNWTAELSQKAYSAQLWQLVKTWELAQAFQLEDRGRDLYGPSADSRLWLNTIPAATAPATVNIPSGPAGMGGSALTNEYFDAAWYELQIVLNNGNHRHRNRSPVDWIYVIGRFQDLYRESQRAEPARLLVALIKSWQSSDQRLGPEDRAQGWRPTQGIDPTILVSPAWKPQFQSLDAMVRRAITEGMLTAWLEKNQQYQIGRYFTPGLAEQAYALPASFGSISGGKVWEAAPEFLAAGVSPAVVQQLKKWGAAYEDVGARFQYSKQSSNRRR